MLKVSRYVAETRTEIEALRIWHGVGAALLLEADPDLGALLLERVLPGSVLAEVADDDQTVRAAAGLLRLLWQPVPASSQLRSLESWCDAYDRNRGSLGDGAAGCPRALFQTADHLRAELIASTVSPVMLHGDVHHFNILRSERAGWLAIDPKGLVGDRCFDVCQFLRNPGPVPAGVNRRRLDIFADELGLERARLSKWCLVHAVLDVCWDFEDGRSIQPALAYAEQALSF